jgi:hypothetical protein
MPPCPESDANSSGVLLNFPRMHISTGTTFKECANNFKVSCKLKPFDAQCNAVKPYSALSLMTAPYWSDKRTASTFY